MIFALITGWLAYKRAVAGGRNGVLWGAIGIGVYIGAQLLVGMGIGIVLGFGVALMEWPESVFDDFALPINIVAIIFAFFASWLLLRFLDKVPGGQIGSAEVAVSPGVAASSDRFEERTESNKGDQG